MCVLVWNNTYFLDDKTIQDLRVTSIQKSGKKQRVEQQTKLVMLSKSEKALRALKKKLNSINELLEKQQSGIKLDLQQIAKTMTLDKVLGEMNELLSNSTVELSSDR